MAVEIILLSLGKKIRELREAKGWTQKQLANAANITPEYISKIETGAKSASIMTLGSIAKALSVELKIDLEKQSGLEGKKTIEWLLKVLSHKSDRDVNIIGRVIELLEEYKEDK